MREKDEQLSRLDAFQELDLDADLDISRQSMGRKRRSCVRKLPFPTNSDDSSDEVDSSKTANALVSSTPQRIKSSLSISESPIIHLSHFEADVSRQGHANSVGRITPLKVSKNVGRKDEYFAQAMATSLIITPYSSPKEGAATGTPQGPGAGDKESIDETVSSNLDCANKTNSSQISFEEGDMSPIYHRKKSREVVSELNEEEYSSDGDSSILECSSSEAGNSTDDDKCDESEIRLKKKSRIVRLVDSDEELGECSSGKDNSILSNPASEDNKGDESIIGVKRKRRMTKPVVSDSDEDYVDKYVSALSGPAVTETNYSKNEESSSSKDLESSVSEGENKKFDESVGSVVSEEDLEILQSSEHKEDKSNYSETSLLEDSESDYDEESDSGKSIGSESLFDDM